MIKTKVEDGCFLVLIRDGVEIYDIDMGCIKDNSAALGQLLKDMRQKQWVTPAILKEIERTALSYMKVEA